MNKGNLLAATKLNVPVIKVNLSKMLLLHPKGNFHLIWDFYIMLCALYNGITLPIDISFYPEWLNTGFFKAFGYIIDVTFLLDIMVNFRTTIIGEDCEDCYDTKIIAK